MAMQEDESATKPQVVANAFVQQYYAILTQNPEIVHKFYQEISTISRPSSDGSVSSATTLTGIDSMILSQDYKDCSFQILNADAQDSLGNALGKGVIILVTGITGRDNIRRKFSQLFFLTPQETGGYFVLNDIFRYFDDEKLAIANDVQAVETAASATVTPDLEPTAITDHSVPDQHPTTHTVNQDRDCGHPVKNDKILAPERETVDNHTVETSHSADAVVSANTPQNNAHPVSETAASDVQEDTPKKSFASVVSALNFNKQPFQQRVTPAMPFAAKPAAKPITAKPVEEPRANVQPAESNLPAGNNSVEKNNGTAKGYSIFVANLPMDATVEQLIQVFEKFGPIKPNGVQVRSYKLEKNCFGFVEFESRDSMQSALQVSTTMIGSRKAHIEEKKAGNNDGGKYPPRRGGFRNDFRGRGNFGSRSFGRNESDNLGGYSGHSRGAGRRNEEGNHKGYQNGGGKVARQAQAQSEES